MNQECKYEKRNENGKDSVTATAPPLGELPPRIGRFAQRPLRLRDVTRPSAQWDTTEMGARLTSPTEDTCSDLTYKSLVFFCLKGRVG